MLQGQPKNIFRILLLPGGPTEHRGNSLPKVLAFGSHVPADDSGCRGHPQLPGRQAQAGVSLYGV